MRLLTVGLPAGTSFSIPPQGNSPEQAGKIGHDGHVPGQFAPNLLGIAPTQVEAIEVEQAAQLFDREA